MDPHLSVAFLARVKAAYARAMAAAAPTSGQWIALDARRADVHAALLADGDDALRAIFADPTITDLYYGVDRLSRSGVRLSDPSQFIFEALNPGDPRVRHVAYQIERLQEVDLDAQTVVEIGLGMGRATYYGHLAGLDYTTIDLPLGIVAQACFLGAHSVPMRSGLPVRMISHPTVGSNCSTPRPIAGLTSLSTSTRLPKCRARLLSPISAGRRRISAAFCRSITTRIASPSLSLLFSLPRTSSRCGARVHCGKVTWRKSSCSADPARAIMRHITPVGARR